VKLAVLKAFREHPEAGRLALIFGVVYFAQGMWSLPAQPIAFTLKERFGLSAAQTATFFALTVIPWLVKPVYGLVSDFVPLFGRRRKSYLLLTSGLAATAGFGLSLVDHYSYGKLAFLFTLMGLGLAFTDVMVDALMVEHGRPLGLTGAFQSVQWASIYAASILVGVAGGYLTGHAPLQVAFALAAVFPLVSFTVALWAVREPPTATRGPQFLQTWLAIKSGFRSRHLWIIVGFIFFWTFSPSIGTALFYYQTDVLKFSQQFIGALSSIASTSAIAGALLYGAFSKNFPFRWVLNSAIGAGVVSTLGYLGYVGPLRPSCWVPLLAPWGWDARLSRPRGTGLPEAGRGDLFRPAHVGVQRGHPALPDHRRLAVRPGGVHQPDPRQCHLHRPLLASGPPAEARGARDPGTPRSPDDSRLGELLTRLAQRNRARMVRPIASRCKVEYAWGGLSSWCSGGDLDSSCCGRS
jgi:MFS family permease